MAWTVDPTAWTSRCCQWSARGGCRGRGGAAWQMEEEEEGGEGRMPGEGRVVGEEMEEGAGEAGATPRASPGARSEV